MEHWSRRLLCLLLTASALLAGLWGPRTSTLATCSPAAQHPRYARSISIFGDVPTDALEDAGEAEMYSSAATVQKRSSVSWLLAAAIRMCQVYPKECLRQRKLQDGMERKRFDIMALDGYGKPSNL